MSPSRPYLIRAIHEWILDNGMTPYLLVDTEQPGVLAPMEFAENGKIILNISPPAVQGLALGNEEIGFNARFRGDPMDVVIPIGAVLAIYARENGRGMVFTTEDGEPDPSGGGDGPSSGGGRRGGKPDLKVVK